MRKRERKIETNRIATIDLLKLFAMLLVIFSHVWQHYGVNTLTVYETPFYNFVWMFRMPAFFLLAGFLNSKLNKCETFSDTLRQILRKALYYLVPYVTFIVPAYLTGFNYGRSFPNLFMDVLTDPAAVLWFMSALFIIESVGDVAKYIANKTKFKNKQLTFIVVYLAIDVVLLALYVVLRIQPVVQIKYMFDLKHVLFYTPFFLVGVILKFLGFERIFKKGNLNIQLCLLVISGLISIVASYRFECFYYFPDDSVFFIFIRYLTGCTSTLFITLLCYFVCKLRVFRFIARGGKYTLEAYYISVICLMPLLPSKLPYDYGTLLLWSFILTGITVAIIAAVIGVMYFIPFTHAIVFGKSLSFYKFEKKLIGKMWHNKKPENSESLKINKGENL